MVMKIYQRGKVTLHCADALQMLATMPDNSVDLIAMDPPYFRVKGEAWDNQWPTAQAYLAWLDEVLLGCWRVLRPTGSLYLFCGRRVDRIKALYWDTDGFVLLYKRLERGQYQWPRTPEEVKELTPQQLRWLQEGLSIYQPKAHRPVSGMQDF